MTTHVVLVDDHTLVRQAVGHLIDAQADLEVVAQAGTVAEGKAILASPGVARQPGSTVVVADVSLPDGTGLSLVRQARELSDQIGIVVLTMNGEDSVLLEALDLGASALVLKSAPAEEILSAVRRAAQAPMSFSANGLADALRRKSSSPPTTLTPRETEVLALLADGLSVAAVGRKLFMSESTVKTHIGKIYAKLGAHNRASAVMAAIKVGLIRPKDR